MNMGCRPDSILSPPPESFQVCSVMIYDATDHHAEHFPIGPASGIILLKPPVSRSGGTLVTPTSVVKQTAHFELSVRIDHKML